LSIFFILLFATIVQVSNLADSAPLVQSQLGNE